MKTTLNNESIIGNHCFEFDGDKLDTLKQRLHRLTFRASKENCVHGLSNIDSYLHFSCTKNLKFRTLHKKM